MIKTKNKLLIILCFLFCVCFALSGVFISLDNGSCAFATDDEYDVYKNIDDYLAEVTKNAHFPATSITVVDKNNTLLSKTYGNCKSPDTPFLLGSVSKSFTALCVMKLVEEGRIDLDAHISAYLSKSHTNNSITVRQLLNHTSGLGEHQNKENYKIVNEQGTHVYANVNYSLLGEIVEQVSGKTYREFVAENVFEPLNMTNSYADVKVAENNGLIQGYENWFGVNTKTNTKFSDKDNAWITTPAGYLSSSTSDLGKYLQMYLNGGQDIISESSVHKMFYAGVAVEASIPYSYGFGWNLIDVDPLTEPVLRHSGLVETGMSVLYILPRSEIAFALAVNTNDYFVGKDMMDRIDWGVALMLMGQSPNQIGKNEYALKHLLYDLIYFVVFAISVLPICLIAIYIKRMSTGKLLIKIGLLLLLHLILPIFILLLPLMFFATPLWVVQAFVPDMFLVIIVSSCLLFIGGIIKTALLIKHKIRNKTKV